MLRRIWNEIFHLSNCEERYEIVKQKFDSELHHFYQVLTPIMAWILFLKRKNEKPNVNNINLSKLITIDEGLNIIFPVTDLYQELEKVCGVKTPCEYQKVANELEKELGRLAPKTFIRGKFEIWFFIKFIDCLSGILPEKGSCKIHTQIGEETAIEILGPRTIIPNSLQNFLKQNLGSPSIISV